MINATEVRILSEARQLKESNRKAVKAVLEADIKGLAAALDSYVKLKKQLMIRLIDLPVLKIHDPDVQRVLTKLRNNEPLEADNMVRFLEEQSDLPGKIDDLDEAEKEDLAHELFYSWYSGYRYVEAMYKTGSLFLKYAWPPELAVFVEEARKCFAFRQYNAVYAMCRVMLEIAARHTCKRKGKIKKYHENVRGRRSPNTTRLLSLSAPDSLRDKIQTIYYDCSELLHGHNRVSDETKALDMLKATLDAVQQIYR